MPLSFVVEWFLKKFHYRDLADAVAPKKRGLFEGTPVITFFSSRVLIATHIQLL